MSENAYVIGAWDEANEEEVYFRFDFLTKESEVTSRLAKSSILFEEPSDTILNGVHERHPEYDWRVCRVEMRVVGSK